MTEPALESELGLATFAGVLRARAEERPDQVAFTYLADGEAEGGRLTYSELERAATAIAAVLRGAVPAGERALLLYPPGLDFIAAFFGCLYAGVVAVPAYPPRPNDRSQSRVRSIARDAEPRAILTTSEVAAGARGLLAAAPELAAARWIATDTLDPSAARADPAPEPDPESVAFLQYTSGSTFDPKGVMVTHANLLHNERMVGSAFGMDEESVVVGWLPLHHDMGLIGNVLQPIHAGARCVLMSPVAFLLRPRRWLQAISRYRGTTSGGPNFAYELCLRKASPEALAGLDLASWRVAFNGAEPVRAATLERFAATFAPCGFRAEAFYPCYGLAEATLFVSGGARGRAPRIAALNAAALERHDALPAASAPEGEATRRLVSCGNAWGEQRLVVADPETSRELRPGAVGEIWISGPSVARGYWRNPEATVRDFSAFLHAADGRAEGPFLRTGDLGFVAGGELYVAGRLKDLVILRGRNHHPQDLELTAEGSHSDLRPGNGAAFSVDVEGEERLVVVHEVERRLRAGCAEVAEAIRRAVAAEHEVQVHEVVLIRPGGLPKTSSGKVQRGLCRRLYLADELPVVGRSALARTEPASETTLAVTRSELAALAPRERRDRLVAYLRERAASALGLSAPAISPAEALTGLGLDSLSAVELKGSVEASLGVEVPLSDLLEGAGIEDLARLVEAGLETGAETVLPPLRAVTSTGDQPLSAGQRGLWFLHRLDPDGGAYNITVAARARGLDPAAFARALAALVDRHEALRTVFPTVDDQPVRRVLAALLPDVRAEDATSWSGRELERRLSAEAWRPFALGDGPLLRARVFARSGAESVVVLAVHHIVADFASMAVVARDLSALYRRETGGAAELGELPSHRYSDYVRWQEELLSSPRAARSWSYWQSRLAGVRDLDLPADHPRPPVQTQCGGARTLTLPGAPAERLRAMAGSTLFTALLAVFQAQLGRYAGAEDFAVGAPTAGRPLPELADLVGYFVNVVALRADLSGEPAFSALLARTRRTVLAALEHGDLPFPALAERLRPTRDSCRSPLFQVLFVHLSEPAARPGDPPGLAGFALGGSGARTELGGLVWEAVTLAERRAQYDLSLQVAEDGSDGLRATLEYNADLFDGTTAERMLGHFRCLLEGAAAAPESSIWSLPLLAGAERAQLLEDWNATARPYPRDLLMHQLFEVQAARTPALEALVVGDRRFSYGELNRRANQLAHHLRRLGVKPEDRVGICLRRSERLVVALFAVLKAGGVYVPLDPAYPRERLERILADSEARWVVGEEGTAPELAAGSPARWLRLDDEAGGMAREIAREPVANPEPLASPGHLAYLIYTSGSTGTPKAVAIEHRSPVVLIHWARETYAPEDLDGVLAATSISFDLSVFEVFAPLSWGGRAIVADHALELPRLPAAAEVTLVNTVPSVMAELLRCGPLPTSVRAVNLGGEPIPAALVAAIHASSPRPRLYNLYGPSEDTTYSTIAPLAAGTEAPIGRPIAGTRVYLLDARGEPLPAGVPGELWIGGEGLARGYLGRPDLTAERFVPDPFASGPGSRLYRTGDLARYRRDGVLDFLGRLDHQVKVRGFRIELGDIESALARHPAVREAVVVARDDGDRGRRLVAYVAPASVPAAELRSFLRGILPDYMIPSAFVGLDSLPLSPNGKVDRRALPDPDSLASGSAPAVGFRTPSEELVAGLFAEVLGREGVGAHDDFFALGGHSLLATRLLAKASRLFGVDLALSAVFLHPTVATLAARIAAAAGGPAAPPIRPLPRPASGLPLSFAQRRLWLLDRLGESSAYHLPGVVRLSGPLDLEVLAAALREIVRRHEALRTVFRLEVGEPVQWSPWHEAPDAPLPRIDLAALAALAAPAAAAEEERLAREMSTAPFDLARGPLWRACALRLGPTRHTLVLTLHHIVADGWSLRILFSELVALYEALAAGRPSPLPELPVQYADWAVWQREQLPGVLEAQLAWWRERLARLPVLVLAGDGSRSTSAAPRAGLRSARLPAPVAIELERIARRHGATPFMLLLAAFQAQLARHTGAPAVPVGTPVANRGRAEIEGVIGLFVNTLVLATPVDGNPTFLELLARAREVCLGAYAHQDLPFERLVEELRPDRDGGRNPLFQAFFQQEEPLPAGRLGEAIAEVGRLETGSPKFDLSLSVMREAEGFVATLEHDAELFDPATASRLLESWLRLVEGVASDPGAHLADLPLLDPAAAAEVRCGFRMPAVSPRPQSVELGLPSTPLEERLVAIWREVLASDGSQPSHQSQRSRSIGVHDDFFELGGHSLLAHRVLLRIHEALGVDLPLKAFFEAPTVAALAERIAEAPAGEAAREGGSAVESAAAYPLSFAQLRLWLLDRIEPGSPKYNVPVALRLRGALDEALLVRALAEIVRRHEPLRTVYAQTEGEAVQVILPAAASGVETARLDLGGLAGLPQPARERALRAALRAAGARAFDLARGPVVRFLLLQLGPEERVLLATFHHIATDGWSMAVFFRELSVLYRDYAAGRESTLPPLPLRYVDWAAWQRRALAEGVLESQLGYWRRELAGLPVLELPADGTQPALAGDRGASRSVSFPVRPIEELRGRLGGRGLTSFNVLLAGFAALLSRLSGQDDFAVGLTSAGRNHLRVEELIGFFVNTLVARVRMTDDPEFGGLVERVRATALAAQAHQDVPFERLVEELQPERLAGVSPFFQAAFTHLASPLAVAPMPGLAARLMDVEASRSKFDLTLSVYEEGGRLNGWVEYRSSRFDPLTIERWMGHLQTLLDGAAADPSRRTSELPLLAPAARWQLAAEWNVAERLAAPELCLHELFAIQAARTPEAPAVIADELAEEIAEGRTLSYRELDAAAERVARRLRRSGVGPEVVVGLFVERSAAMVVGLLGILKAGGAYVPLDPAYPAGRLAGMLEDSAATVLLAGEDLAERWPPHDGARLILLEPPNEPATAAEGAPEGAAEVDFATRVLPENLACVLFTSGSTGRPKGVMLHHRGLVNRLLWAQATYGLTPDDAVLLKAPLGFDFSLWECFAPLLAGGRLIVARPGGHRETGYLARAIARHGVTCAHFVPSLLELFLREEGVAECRSLRQVFAGGERLSPELRERFLAVLPGIPLDNQYGPTEISIDTTRWVCAPGQDPRRVPIGRPIGNTRIHLLDRSLRLVPLGVHGLLHVGGLGVARGYAGRPDWTAERFVPDPNGSGERLYDTGDLARRLPDGNLEFLGRADQQVKVRGIRVEPAEVEAALLRHPDLAAAAVAADPEGSRLIAWLVPRPGAPLASSAPAALRDFLRQALPEAMIPSLYVRVEALPLTPSGKLDRRALSALEVPAGERLETAAPAPAANTTPIEELLAGIWSDLLGAENVGAHDSFFDLGGHSLLAIQAVSRIREACGVELPLADLFAAPAPADLAPRIAQARGEARCEAHFESDAAAPPLRPSPREPAGDPLSFAQEQLWFLQRLEPESSAYNVAGALRLRGALRPEALEASLREISRRHESLRTLFREGAGGLPVQIVLPPPAAGLPVIDLRAAARPEEVAQRLLRNEARRPFDLAAGPLVRPLLLRLGDDEHLLAAVLHHIISDAWSLRLVLRELAALYRSFAAGEPSPLPEPSLQFADFARWQRRRLAEGRMEAELAFWRQTLAGAPEGLDLPRDRPASAASTHPAGRLPVALAPALAADLRALARRQGWTPFMVLHAAFGALLARLSGEQDIVVGVPVANRTRLEAEALVGFFTNTLALRLDATADPTFRALVRRSRRATLEAFAHQDLPLERLVTALAPRRARGRAPLFQVMLALNDVPALEGLELPGLALEGVEIAGGDAKFDLTLLLSAGPAGVAGHLEFDRGRFDPTTAERLGGHFLTLLAAAVALPETRLSRLPLLTPPEREQLAAWSRSPLPPARPWCVHERVEVRAALHPQAEAVIHDGATLTYGDLLRRSRRVARGLRGLGVGPDVPVGIFLERSLDLAVAILGVLRAGGAYLPLDPAYPAERLGLMLDDARAPLVLTSEPLRARLPESASRIVLIAELLAAPEPAGAEALTAVDPGNLAYVIYTSGSTGRPKGVAMPHGALAALLDWQLRTSQAGAGRTFQFAALPFDVSFQEIFSAWSAGGSVVLVAETVRRDPPALLRLLSAQRVERLFLPFVALQQLALAARPGEMPSHLREVMSAGEQLYVTPQVAALFSGLPGAVLYNHYGPAETHCATWLALRGTPAEWPERPSIGRGVDHARVFLLDRDLAPVPVGVAGEVFVGGAGLARGYLHQPALTAERFLPDPFDEVEGWEAGARLYRTGDRAHWLPGGEIEYLGRGDRQVKIRGHRVELAEVEAALARHPALRQAAVAAVGTPAAARRLVGYAVFRADSEPPTFSELRAFLLETLPEAMVPSAWVRLAELPRTPSGKVDRRALPAPVEVGDEGAFVAPRDPAEEILEGIWREVLGLRRIGVHDDFFELGGHSLLATQVMSRLRDAFGVELPLVRLFEGPTVAELGRAVSVALAAGGAIASEPIARAARGEGEGLPLSFGQERLWFLDRLQPEGTVYSLPLELRLAGDLDAPALGVAFAELARRHETLRTVFAERGAEPRQVVLPPPGAALPVVDLGTLPPAQREREALLLAAAELARPFDLRRGPLLRTTLLRLAEREHRLLLNLHHIVSDGWSMGVLTREMAALYAALLAGLPSPLAELPIQYADFAAWQRRRLGGTSLAPHLDYWRERLRGLPQGFELHADRPRPAERSWRGAQHRFALDAPLAADLAALGRREGATSFMVLAASMLALLSRLSGESDLAIGTPIANRNRAETEGLIGFFVNTLVLRAELRGATDFLALLRQVRDTTLGAYGHQEMPFERLIEELQPVRDPSRTPLFQVMFALQNTPLPPLTLPGLEVSSAEPASGNAKFDLTIALMPREAGLAASLEYATDLFDRPTVLRFAAGWLELLAAAVREPAGALRSLPLLAAPQRQQILREWNDTDEFAAAPPGDPLRHLLHGPFERRAELQPDALAAVCAGERLTYDELERRANRLARLLRGLGAGAGAGAGAPVAIWMERSLDMVVAVLAVLKAGAHYLPLDLSWPRERAEAVLTAARAPILLTRAAQLPPVLETQWRTPLAHVVCLDVGSPRPPAEPLDAEEVRSLWDFVAERAVDRVSAGGFVSSYTGLPFSAAEVDEYRDRVLALAAPWLRPGARVLEIGCGSGLILWEMAPRAARLVGLDPSPRTQERNRAYAAERGFDHLELRTGFAHEIDELPAAAFDLIVMASTAQFFPGPLYLEQVVRKAVELLAPDGALLIADVPDARRRSDFQRSLAESGSPARSALRTMSWFDEDLFHDVASSQPVAGRAVVHRRDAGFANELRFRYDVVLTRGDGGDGEGAEPRARRKRLWTAWHVEHLEEIEGVAADRSAAASPPPPSPDALAYVIHTSGSTGAPKGIGVRHRSAAALIGWVNATFGVGPEDRLLFVTSLGFDLSVYDLFGTLAAGGTIQIAPEAALRDPERLAGLLREVPVTIWNSAPAALQRLAPLFPEPAAPAATGRETSSLRLVLLSGDWIPVGLPDQVRKAFPGARVISLGGATEATVWSNWYPIGEVDPRWPSIPYGRPLANARYYALDGDLRPAPIGIPGDLYIGGDVLSVGYVYEPALTAAQFLPDPYAPAGARMYRTGDRVRYRADGNLEFLGRVDNQVKVRGYRIELGEIEVALCRHPGVREAVVLALGDGAEERRLAAYFVPSRPPAPQPSELRAFLLESLPEYMVPWAFVELEAFPVTSNGKLDRAALPAPRAATAAADSPPRNALERAIAAVWREVLQVDRVGVHDNFFESGGSSLLVVKLHTHLKAALGRDVPVLELFRHTTIDALARRLAEEPDPRPEEACAERVRDRARTRQDSLREMRQARAGRRGGSD
jgi:amino acid adenylation domain-containing protein